MISQNLQEVETGPMRKCSDFKLWAPSTYILCDIQHVKRRDKLEFTQESKCEVMSEHQQGILYSVARIKLRINLRPRDVDYRASKEKNF